MVVEGPEGKGWSSLGQRRLRFCGCVKLISGTSGEQAPHPHPFPQRPRDACHMTRRCTAAIMRAVNVVADQGSVHKQTSPGHQSQHELQHQYQHQRQCPA